MRGEDHNANLDGEVADHQIVSFTGNGLADRSYLEGERVAFTVIAEVSGLSFKRKDGALIRQHKFKIESVAEPTEQLLTDVTDFIRAVDDAREGRTPLPLDEDEEGDQE